MALLTKLLPYKRWLTFLLVGGSATCLQFAILVCWVEFFAQSAVVGSALGYGLSAVYNYLLNYYVTFKSRQSHLQSAPKFLLVVIAGLCINTLVFALLNHLLPYWIAQLGATLATLIANYLLHHYWIYPQDD